METYLSKTTAELYRWYEVINEHLYDNKLPDVIITIQKTRSNTLGWFTTSPVWVDANAPEPEEGKEIDLQYCKYEINISAQALQIHDDWDIAEIVAVLIHEMQHLSNKLAGIKDVSGKIHNKRWKSSCDQIGLICEKGKSCGWGITHPNDNLRSWILNDLKPDASQLMYYRTLPPAQVKEKQLHPVYHVYCENCGKKFDYKPKKKDKDNFDFMNDFGFICKSCGTEMQVEEDEA